MKLPSPTNITILTGVGCHCYRHCCWFLKLSGLIRSVSNTEAADKHYCNHKKSKNQSSEKVKKQNNSFSKLASPCSYSLSPVGGAAAPSDTPISSVPDNIDVTSLDSSRRFSSIYIYLKKTLVANTILNRIYYIKMK